MKETRETTGSRIGQRGYIKRWLILIAVGVVAGIGRVLVDSFSPAELGQVLGVLVLGLYGLPALALSVVWTMHRATDADKDEAWGFLILIPIVNIVAVVVFALLPSRENSERST